MPLKSLFPSVHLPDTVSLPDLILTKIKQNPDPIAMIDGLTGQKITFKQFVHMVECMTASMHQRGLRKGNVVFIFSPSCIEFIVAYLAMTSLGAILAAVNPQSSEEELMRCLSDTKPTWLIAHASVCDTALNAANRVGAVMERYVIGTHDGCKPITELLLGNAGDAPRVHINPRQDVCAIMYSSGTTGLPKGVLLTHYNQVSNLTMINCPELTFKTEEAADARVHFLPCYHVSGLLGALSFLYHGHITVIFPRFELERYLQALQDYKARTLTVVTPVADMLAKHPAVDKYNLESVRSILVGAAPVSKHTEMECTKRLKLESFRNCYGMTELGHTTHVIPNNAKEKHGSVGVMLRNIECMVVDVDNGRELGANEDGELWIKSPGLMKGYLNQPQATADAITPDGFYKTGDIGHYDEDGYFFIVDRLKELIKCEAHQVAPAELEALIMSHAAVADVAVIGIPDEAAGEVARAYVVKKADVEVSGEDLVHFVAEHMAPQKQIRGGVIFLTKIPRSPAGKIMRRILREQVIAEGAQHGKC